MNTMRLSVISGVALLGLALTAPLAAVAADSPLTVTVAYDDLNPANKQDAAELYLRLQSATKQVCAPYAISQSNGLVAKKNCYRYVLARAVQDARVPEVTALYARAFHDGQASEQLAARGSSGANMSKANMAK
jgi:UrcA family protein